MSTHPLRIVHVIARMNVGGPAILISELINGLQDKNFQSFLITGYCQENEIDFLQANKMQVSEIRIKGFGRSVSLLSDILAFFRLMKALREIKPDIVHTHTAKAGVIGRLTALIAVPRAKRIHTFHGHLLHGYFSNFKTQILILIEKLLAKITDQILTIGNQVRIDLLNAGIGVESKMRFVFPGIRVKSTISRKEIRSSLGISDEKLILIFVGRLTQIKRPDRLIKAFRLASNSVSNMTLLIVGDGDLREISEKLATGLDVRFLGWRTDVYDLMNASDIAILTSDNEGMPITLIEAAHLGLPAISTDVGSVSDVVIHSKTGFLTSLDELEIAERIKVLAGSSLIRKEFGTAAKSIATSKFSVENMVAEHKKIYFSLIDK
mgnify:FL=1